MSKPEKVTISLGSLYKQHPDAPKDVAAFVYKGNLIAISFTTGIVYRVHKQAVPTKWNRIKDGTLNAPHTNYSWLGINHRMELLHRVIKSCEVGRYLVDDVDLVDHRDGVGTHNWSANLRLYLNDKPSNASGNQRNRRSQGVSQAYGVHWDKQKLRFKAQVGLRGARVYLGLYVNELAAAFVSDIFTYYLHGEHARLNDPRCKLFYQMICSKFDDAYALMAYLRSSARGIDSLFDDIPCSREHLKAMQARNR